MPYARKRLLATALFLAMAMPASASALTACKSIDPEQEALANEQRELAGPVFERCMEARYGLKPGDYQTTSVEPKYQWPTYSLENGYYVGYTAAFSMDGEDYLAFFDPEQGGGQPFLCDLQTEELVNDAREFFVGNFPFDGAASVEVLAGKQIDREGRSHYLLGGYYDGEDFFSPIPGRSDSYLDITVCYINYGGDLEEAFADAFPGAIPEEALSKTGVYVAIYDFESRDAMDAYFGKAEDGRNVRMTGPLQTFYWSSDEDYPVENVDPYPELRWNPH